MITKKDVETIVHAIQAAAVRPGLTMCCILVDTEDGSLATFAPPDVNKERILEMACDLYGIRKPDRQADIHPKADPTPASPRAAKRTAAKRRREN